MQREVLVGSRPRWAAVLGLAVLLVVIGAQSGFWPASVFFGACAVVASIVLIRPSRLILDDEGFTATTLGRSVRYGWADIARFGVTTIPISNLKMVGLDFALGYPRAKGTATSRAISGFDGALPETYGQKAEDLVLLLQERRRRAVGGQ